MDDWQLPSAGIVLDSQQVHLWHAALEATPEQLLDYWSWLAPEERERAERFHFPQHRDRFAIGRGILRALLGNYLDVPPARVRLERTVRGKPYLADNAPLAFNISHSQQVALYAFAWNVELGVDLEVVRPMPEAVPLAARFFCPTEASYIATLPANERSQGFFRAWTRKEAYLKATGEGLQGLADIEVTVAADAPARILTIAGDRQRADRWSLYHLEPTGLPCVAALALGSAPAWPLQRWRFLAPE